MEFISLANNNICTYENIKPLFDYIGQKKISQEEAEKYNETKLEIERIKQVNDKLRAAKKQV